MGVFTNLLKTPPFSIEISSQLANIKKCYRISYQGSVLHNVLHDNSLMDIIFI